MVHTGVFSDGPLPFSRLLDIYGDTFEARGVNVELFQLITLERQNKAGRDP